MEVKKVVGALLAAVMIANSAALTAPDRCFSFKAHAAIELDKRGAKELECLKGKLIGEIKAMPNGKLAAKSADTDQVFIINTKTDTVTETIDRVPPNTELVGVQDDGTLIIAYFGGENLIDLFYKEDARYDEMKSSYNASVPHLLYYENGGGAPSIADFPVKRGEYSYEDGVIYFKDGSAYYQIADKKIVTKFRFKSNEPRQFLDYDAANDVLMTYYDGNDVRAAYDLVCEKGSNREEILSIPFYNHQVYWYESEAKIVSDMLVTYGSKCRTENPERLAPLRCYDLKTGKFITSFKIDDDYLPHFESASKYGILLPKSGSTDSITFIDPQKAVYERFDIADESKVTGEALSGSEWAVLAESGEGETAASRLYVFDLSKSGSSGKYDVRPEVSTVGKGMEAARKRADEIEKKFGITILFGDEVNDMTTGTLISFETDMTEEYMNTTLLEQLDELDGHMSKYPEGFFKVFLNSEGKGGYIFVGAKATLNEKGAESGFMAYTSGANDRYMVTCSTEFFGGWVGYHENFHAVEKLVSKKYPIDPKEWNSLNPEGHEDFNIFAPENAGRAEASPYIIKNTDDPYFITTAAQGSASEDRAIMMGQLCCSNDPTEFPAAFEDRYEYVKNNYPHIMAKLDYMAKWVEQYYGYVYWTSILGLPDDEFDEPHTDFGILPTTMRGTGDVNSDKKVDIQDAAMIINHINGVASLTDQQLKYADADKNFVVDIKDAAAVINSINGVKPL